MNPVNSYWHNRNTPTNGLNNAYVAEEIENSTLSSENRGDNVLHISAAQWFSHYSYSYDNSLQQVTL